jgi:FkbH-like protein
MNQMRTTSAPRISELPDQIANNLGRFAQAVRIRLAIISSANLGPIDLTMKRYASESGVDLDVLIGSFDNPVDDASALVGTDVDYVLFVPFLDSSIPGVTTRLRGGSDEETESLIESFVARWEIAASQLPKGSQLLCCLPEGLFRPSIYGPFMEPWNGVAELRIKLMERLALRQSVSFIDSGAIISRLGERAAMDLRSLFRGKAPFTLHYLDELSRLTWRLSREFGSRYPKAIVVDCDNTLWGGVIGEDGIAGIKLDPFDFPGNIFWQVQTQLKYLQANGVLLCLATKNEESDVEEVLQGHGSMVLKTDDFVVKKISWEDKPSMIKSIAQELNIGTDTITFIDDSEFEITAVSEQLPEVAVFQVPDVLADYPLLMEEVITQFQPMLNSSVGGSKTFEYQARKRQNEDRALFATNEDYLRALDVRLLLVCNERDRMTRLSELTMKTNQFNLTTQRLTEGEISDLMASESHEVWSCHVVDRFADHGLTGLAIVHVVGQTAEIVNFMLSCRVLGRGIEKGYLGALCNHLFSEGLDQIVGIRRASARNGQTASFYPDNGFGQAKSLDHEDQYCLKKSSPTLVIPEWITVSVRD